MQTRIYFKTSDGLSSMWTPAIGDFELLPYLAYSSGCNKKSDLLFTTSECPALSPQTKETTDAS